ncbi:hypothetical protein [uncultured Erythrobacter sp.]|uniref:hypothetical protein n=1 Tax=uncultured Erythrobacter sp. TaxID=263913 RepID=UPI00260AAF4B|nr:hypothetical protein [uncultured Erythrobacter sp.]
MTETPPRLPTPDEAPWNATNLLANRPFIICVLYLCSYFTGISAIVGVVLAHVFIEGAKEEWEHTQFQYLIRTFWMLVGSWMVALIGGIVVAIQTDGGAGIIAGALLAFATLILASARTVYAMINAVRQKPMPRPRTLLI